jgi:stage V sporulation protein D (sporulation-specific penicillin-binding protein)
MDRIGIIWYIAIAYTILLLFTSLKYTVINHDFYKKIAYDQQTMVLKNPVSRGSIYSSAESLRGALSVSTNLGNLAIDPSQTWSRDKLLSFLSDVVFDEYCTYNTSCLASMTNYLREDLTGSPDIAISELKKKIRDHLERRMDTPVESVQLADNLDDEKAEIIGSWQDPSLFFVVNHLYVNPTKVVEPAVLATRLASVLDIEEEKILAKLELKKKRHLEIIRKMNVSTRDTVMTRITNERLAIKNKELLIEESIVPYLKIEDNLVRFYPEKNITSQITGFVDGEWAWKYGIEWYFEGLLQAESPTERVIKDSANRPIDGYVSKGLIASKNGIDITLTIDRNIQKEIRARLETAVKKFRANKWSIIVMDPTNGAVRAMVNYPDYDANNFTQVYEMETVDYAIYRNPWFDLFGTPLYVVDSLSGTTFANIEGQRLKLREAEMPEINNFTITKYKYKNKYGSAVYTNDIISAFYEPGSVFKAITTAIGIDTGEIRPDDTYYDKGYVELFYEGSRSTRIRNLASQCSGRHTYIHALNWSCNVGMISIIEKIGPSLFHKYLSDFEFWAKTNITLDGENYSKLSPYEKWSRTQFFTMSFGQGISTTMLQMAAAYSVLANGGIYMEPHIVESVTYPDGKKVDTIPTPLRRVIKAETSKSVTAMLVDGVRNGFAKKWWVPGYTVAGKTGTSQIPYKWTYENLALRQDLGHTITSYGGYAPANNPKFVLIVVINRPRSDTYSENTSSALFAEIAKYLLEYYKIPKNGQT